MSPTDRLIDTIIINANIITMDENDSRAEAILIRGDKIIVVGSNSEVEQQCNGNASRIDAKGATVLPGLLDTHPHLLHYGSLEEPLIKIWDCANHQEIVAEIKERAETVPVGTWLQTTPVGEPHFFHRRSYKDLEEGILPDRYVLDRASTYHPIVIQAWGPTRPNCMALNSAGLQELGITKESPDRINNVWIEKDVDGEPTGILTGSVTTYYNYDEFASKIWRKIPFLQNEMLVPGTESAIKLYHQQGVTGVYENHMMDKVLIDAYRQLRSDNKLQMRVLASQEAEAYGMPWSKPRTIDDFMARLEQAAASIEQEDPRFRFNGISMMWDGYCYGGSQMMRLPYLDVYGCLTHGHRHISPDKAEIVARFCAERKLGLNVLAMGIAAHDEVLELMERLAGEYDIASLNWVLVHATTIEENQVERYKRLNFSHTTSMTFCYGEGALIKRSMGDKVLDDMIPLRRFFDKGMAVGGSSDWGPKNIWEQIELSLTFEFGETGYRNLGESQKISRTEAVGMFTREAAKVMKWPEIGSLEKGKNADLIIIDRDPIDCEIDKIRDTVVLKTIFSGDTVYCNGEL